MKVIKKLKLVYKLISYLKILRKGDDFTHSVHDKTKKIISKIQSQAGCPICHMIYQLIKTHGLNYITEENFYRELQKG